MAFSPEANIFEQPNEMNEVVCKYLSFI